MRVRPSRFLDCCARRFFSHADKDTLLTWRILMTGQYRHESARDSVRAHLLDAPIRFFTNILEALRRVGKIRQDVDCASVGRIIAAVFFDYSFRSNLDLAWGDDADEEGFARLGVDLGFIAKHLTC
jgi:DNA-directed RNA polymerase subunit N (RpoN/RPB10)